MPPKPLMKAAQRRSRGTKKSCYREVKILFDGQHENGQRGLPLPSFTAGINDMSSIDGSPSTTLVATKPVTASARDQMDAKRRANKTFPSILLTSTRLGMRLA
jgi:hypothetical protein